MEMRFLGGSGLRVSVIGFGTMTFRRPEQGHSVIGNTDVAEARALIDHCLDAGVNLIDTADVYTRGVSEEIVGEALRGRRDRVVLATKVFFRMGDGPNDVGLSRAHIVRACEDSLRRLNTDYIDLYQAHGFDAYTPLDETLAAFDDLIRAGKVRYAGCSNYSGWHLMKALAVAERDRSARYVSQQVYYSIAQRDIEYELVPLSLDQQVGILVWSPLAGGFLTGKFRRGQQQPSEARMTHATDPLVMLPDEQAYDIIEAMDAIAQARGVSVAQVALNWLLRRPAVTSLIIGARNQQQLADNLAAATWSLSDEEMAALNAVSDTPPIYPYWHQRRYASERNPPLPAMRPFTPDA